MSTEMIYKFTMYAIAICIALLMPLCNVHPSIHKPKAVIEYIQIFFIYAVIAVSIVWWILQSVPLEVLLKFSCKVIKYFAPSLVMAIIEIGFVITEIEFDRHYYHKPEMKSMINNTTCMTIFILIIWFAFACMLVLPIVSITCIITLGLIGFAVAVIIEYS